MTHLFMLTSLFLYTNHIESYVGAKLSYKRAVKLMFLPNSILLIYLWILKIF
jgi:hypothetical protein